MNIDIKKLKGISKELDELKNDEVMFVNDNGTSRFVVMPIEMYEMVEDLYKDEEESNELLNPQIKIVGPEGFQLSYDEYENVKKQINDAFEKIFKPKPEKLN